MSLQLQIKYLETLVRETKESIHAEWRLKYRQYGRRFTEQMNQSYKTKMSKITDIQSAVYSLKEEIK